MIDRSRNRELLEEDDGEDGENDLAVEDPTVRDWRLLPSELVENKDGEEKDPKDEQDDLEKEGTR